MSLKSSSRVDTNRVQLEIAVDAKTFEKAVERAYRKENKKIAVPGFRKGKAPRRFIEKLYGENFFYDDAIKDVYPGAVKEAVRDANLKLVDDMPEFKLVSAGKDGLDFKVTVTTKPEVKIDGYKGISAKEKDVEPTETEVQNAIERVRNRTARWVTVEDREAKKGDVADIDYDGSVDGKPFLGGKAENYNLVLGEGKFIPGFEEQLIGHKTGDEFDVKVTFPGDYGAKDLAGKSAVFQVKIHEIKEKELPKVDDDFVKDVSEFDTLEEYKADIRKQLLDMKKKDADADIENQLTDKLIALMKADIPEAMIRNQVDDDVNDFEYRLSQQGMNLQTYFGYTKSNMEDLRKKYRPDAEKQVKLRLALEKIAELENIHPSDEEVEKYYEKAAKHYELKVEDFKKMVPRENITEELTMQKSLQLVKDSAVITRANPAGEKTAEKAAEASGEKTAE